MKKLVAIILAIGMLLSLGACGSQDSNTADNTDATPATETKEEETSAADTQEEETPADSSEEVSEEVSGEVPSEITIGLIGPVTGDTAYLGEDMRMLADLLQAEVNEAGGVNGIPVTFILEDDAGNSSGAATAAQKHITVNNVNAILGPLFTSNVLAVKPIVNEAEVPTMIPTSADSGIFQEDGYVFSLDAANDVSVKLLCQYLSKEKGFTKLAILGNYNDQTLSMIDYFGEFWTEYGGTIVYSSTFNSGTDDFRTELTKIKDAQPEALWISADTEEFLSMSRQLVELGMDDIFIATDYQAIQAETFDVVGEYMDGRLIYTQNGVASDEETSAKYEAFSTAWEDAYGVAPEAHTSLLYDCAHLVLEAMSESGCYSGDGLRQALLNNTDFVGVSGYPVFDNYGKSEGSSTIVIYENGETVVSDFKIQ